MTTGFVYIMASESRTLYTGVASNLERRVWEHKTHAFDGFSSRYRTTRLVYIAEFSRMDDAIAWEKAIKGKSRAKKIALIEEANPRWNDLTWNWFEQASREGDRTGAVKSACGGCASRGDPSLRSG